MILGLDPGVGGGIAVLVGDGIPVRTLALAKATEAEAAHFLAEQVGAWKNHDGAGSTIKAYLEKVNATPQMGVCSAFTFGKGYGLLRGLLIGLEIPFEEVSPQRWRGALGIKALGGGLGGNASTARKQQSRARAQELYPSLKVTNAIADALLIATYGARQGL